MQYVIFVGNPGTGKSALLNSLIGQCSFKSGVSYGHGLTSALQLVTRDNVTYGDTPGLSDINMRKQAASEIKQALTKGGSYKLVFIVTTESGRVRPDDVTTMKLVLDSISDNKFPYGVIVNKVSARIMIDAQNKDKVAPIVASLNCGHRPANNVLFLPKLNELEDADNVVVAADANLTSFLAKMTPKVIKPESVHDIAVQDFDSLKESFEKQLNSMRSDMMQQRMEYERQLAEYRDQRSNQLIGELVAGTARFTLAVLLKLLEDD